ncbi:MAG: cytochrome c peroxidase [Bacteroidota bacterium]
MKRLLTIIVSVGTLAGCIENRQVDFSKVQAYALEEVDKSMTLLDQLKIADQPEKLKSTFAQARLAFKKAEPFAAYLHAEAAHRVNGPPLSVFKEDNGKVLPSVGFQALEEVIYADDEIDKKEFDFKIKITKGYIQAIKDAMEEKPINPQRFFVPMHQQLLRIYSVGLSGFDTPGSFLGLNESARLLESFGDLYQLSIGDTLKSIDPELHANFLSQLQNATEYIDENSDFETFDRYEFGRVYLNPITESWVRIRKETQLFEDPKRFAINLDAPTFFEENSFNLRYFQSSYNRNPSGEQIALGKRLFHEINLSESGRLSCASCHNPTNFYQDGLEKGLDKEGEQLLRNTPTIINVAFQKKFFWDGRSDNLEQQIMGVFTNEREFDTRGHLISDEILDDEQYQSAFSQAYPNEKFNKTRIIRALAAYTGTLNALNSRFDRNMRGALDDFTEEEKRGMNLYMGKALCATCHFVPLMNGTVPPLFGETEKEILGTPKTPKNLEVDTDEGFYWVFEADIHKYMFKTPTVRNADKTAPYMHNGVYTTLEQVMDFYNKGGGGGMNFDLPHQTLPFDSLNLSQNEQQAVIAFMKTLTDQPDQY